MSPSSSNSYLKDSPPLKKRKVGSQPKKIYKQSFRYEWLSVSEYVQWIKKDNDKVKCIVCAITLLSKKSAIDDHVKTQRHVRLMAEKLDKKATKLTTFFNKNPVNTSRYNPGRTQACCLGCRTWGALQSIRPSPCCSGFIFSDSKIAKAVTLKRTKVSSIIYNVMRKDYLEELRNHANKETDMGSASFRWSLMKALSGVQKNN